MFAMPFFQQGCANTITEKEGGPKASTESFLPSTNAAAPKKTAHVT